MLTVTEAAGGHLAQLLVENDASDNVAIRFVLDGQSLTPKLDHVRPDDVTFDHEGKIVLVLDESLSERLADKTLDTTETGDGLRLRLH